MPFLLIRNDITKVQADAIVNPANPQLQQGSGTSRAIYLAAGENKMIKACKKIGTCELGKAVITRGFNLPARYVIHTVGPVWQGGGYGEDSILYGAYTEALRLAKKYRLKSIAFPLLSSGNYGYPKERALKIAISAISDFLMENDMLVYMVLYDRKSLAVSQKLFVSVEEYIDDHYVDVNRESFFSNRSWSPYQQKPNGAGAFSNRRFEMPEETAGAPDWEIGSPEEAQKVSDWGIGEPEKAAGVPDWGFGSPEKAAGAPDWEIESPEEAPQFLTQGMVMPQAAPQPETASGKSRKLEDLMKNMGETFSRMLLRLIDERGMTDAQVYRKANIDRRHFSKIRKNADYAPNKRTVMAFVIALELSLDEANDLLRAAGFSFSNSSKSDVIIQFFLENEIYNIFEINEVLFAYDQPLLGE